MTALGDYYKVLRPALAVTGFSACISEARTGNIVAGEEDIKDIT